MIDVTEPPARPYTGPIGMREAAAGRSVHRKSIEQPRKIDPGIDGELQPSPESSIHFHKIRDVRFPIDFEFDHRDTVPVRRLNESYRIIGHRLGKWYAFTQYTN